MKALIATKNLLPKNLLLTTLLLSTQASAAQVVCELKNNPAVKLTIASTSLVSGEHTILITAKGLMESTYQLTPLTTNQSRTLLTISAYSDIGYFIRQTPVFELNPPPPAKVRRVVQADLELEMVDTGSDVFFMNMASGKGKLTLNGDLTGAYPRLEPVYELENCEGEFN